MSMASLFLVFFPSFVKWRGWIKVSSNSNIRRKVPIQEFAEERSLFKCIMQSWKEEREIVKYKFSKGENEVALHFLQLNLHFQISNF